MIWRGVLIVLMGMLMRSNQILFFGHHHHHSNPLLHHHGILPHMFNVLPPKIFPHHFHPLSTMFHHHHIVARSVDNENLNKTEEQQKDVEVKEDKVKEDNIIKLPKVVVQHNGETIFQSDNCVTGKSMEKAEGDNAKPPVNSNQAQLMNPYYYDQYLQYPYSLGYQQLLYSFLRPNSYPDQLTLPPSTQSTDAILQQIDPSLLQHLSTNNNQQYHQLVFPAQPYITNQQYKPSYYHIPPLGSTLDDKKHLTNYAFSPLIYKPQIPGGDMFNKHPTQRLLDSYPMKPVHLIPIASTKQAPCPSLYYNPPEPKADPYPFISPDKYITSINNRLHPYIFS